MSGQSMAQDPIHSLVPSKDHMDNREHSMIQSLNSVLKAASVLCFAESRKLSFKQSRAGAESGGRLRGREPGPLPSDVPAAVLRP